MPRGHNSYKMQCVQSGAGSGARLVPRSPLFPRPNSPSLGTHAHGGQPSEEEAGRQGGSQGAAFCMVNGAIARRDRERE